MIIVFKVNFMVILEPETLCVSFIFGPTHSVCCPLATCIVHYKLNEVEPLDLKRLRFSNSFTNFTAKLVQPVQLIG
uniref:Uncharacterized protein n=1 Tax=Anguilla anguilla TaxID=7936 RepID=A0A0E9WCR9_ANGAN